MYLDKYRENTMDEDDEENEDGGIIPGSTAKMSKSAKADGAVHLRTESGQPLLV